MEVEIRHYPSITLSKAGLLFLRAEGVDGGKVEVNIDGHRHYFDCEAFAEWCQACVDEFGDDDE